MSEAPFDPFTKQKETPCQSHTPTTTPGGACAVEPWVAASPND